MPAPVVDRSSNTNEQIVQAAEVIKRSEHRQKVFGAIYRGKKRIKSVKELAKATGLTEKQVLIAGKRLADGHVVDQVGPYGSTGYQKVGFFQPHYRRILRLATNAAARNAIPTKQRPAAGQTVRVALDVRAPARRVRARRITVDDIESFSRVRCVCDEYGYTKIPENRFKQGVAKILGERGTFNDWGGELRDLASTRVRIRGRRHAAAFAFKGPGASTKRLTPGKMGKNGDQIQRLARCPADVFLVQFWAQIEDSVVEQLETFVRAKALLEGREVFFGVIDGVDSSRLIAAYPRAFPGVTPLEA